MLASIFIPSMCCKQMIDGFNEKSIKNCLKRKCLRDPGGLQFRWCIARTNVMATTEQIAQHSISCALMLHLPCALNTFVSKGLFRGQMIWCVNGARQSVKEIMLKCILVLCRPFKRSYQCKDAFELSPRLKTIHEIFLSSPPTCCFEFSSFEGFYIQRLKLCNLCGECKQHFFPSLDN